MSRPTERPAEPSATGDWPTFSLRYTFNPDGVEGRGRIDPDDLVVFDPANDAIGEAWVIAARGAYVAVEDAR